MKELKADDIYELGWSLGWFESIVANANPTWKLVKDSLGSLCSYRTVEGLESIGSDAQGQLSSLGRKCKNPDSRLHKDDLSYLNFLSSEWAGRISEVSRKWVMCTPKTQLDIHKLSLGAKSFFTKEEWSALSDLEQQGFDEAAACLLTNNFTASEMMVLRTIESVLRRWYGKKTGESVARVKLGNVINYLDAKYPEKDRPDEISSLFHFKRRRNSVAHPDVISVEADASVTFQYAVKICKAVKSFLIE